MWFFLASHRGLFESVDVQFLHLQHCFRHAPSASAVGILHQLCESCRNDLPAHAVAIAEPPALFDCPTVRQRIPEMVDLGLVTAVHDERYGVVEGIEGAGADSLELLTGKRELNDRD